MIHRSTTPEGYRITVVQSSPTYFEISIQRNDIILYDWYDENPPNEDRLNNLARSMIDKLKAMPEEQTRLYAKEVALPETGSTVPQE